MDFLPHILAMLTLVALSGLLTRGSNRLPLPLVQVALGAMAAWPTHGLRVSLDPQLFMALFIPPLLFADGWQAPKREFSAYRGAILGLSIGLVLATIVALGWLIHWMVPSVPLPLAFLLAAVLSPTDAVAVSGIVGGRSMPPRLRHVLEGESLMNDASALVAMKVALAAALTQHFSLRQALSEFVAMACGGLLVGAGFSWGFMRIHDALRSRGEHRRRATIPTVLLLFLLPFAPYMIAERLGFSGVLAAVAAGMAASVLEVKRCRFDQAHLQAKESWAVVSFAFHGLVFVLLGSQLPSIVRRLPALPDGRAPAAPETATLVATVAVVVVALYALRLGWFLAVQELPRWIARSGRRSRPAQGSRLARAAVGTLGGIRGALTLAAIMSVPATLPDGTAFPARDLMVFVAAVVILVSLALGGVMLPRLLRGMAAHAPSGGDRGAREASRAEHRACRAVLQMLDAQGVQAFRCAASTAIREQIDRSYRHRMGVVDPDPRQRESACEALSLERSLRLQALQTEREELHRLRLGHQINDATLFKLVHEIDLQERLLRYRD